LTGHRIVPISALSIRGIFMEKFLTALVVAACISIVVLMLGFGLFVLIMPAAHPWAAAIGGFGLIFIALSIISDAFSGGTPPQ
jgi:hypothetical protein